MYGYLEVLPDVIKYIDFPIQDMLVNSIEILIGPKTSEAEKTIVRALTEKYCKNPSLSESKLSIRKK